MHANIMMVTYTRYGRPSGEPRTSALHSSSAHLHTYFILYRACRVVLQQFFSHGMNYIHNSESATLALALTAPLLTCCISYMWEISVVSQCFGVSLNLFDRWCPCNLCKSTSYAMFIFPFFLSYQFVLRECLLVLFVYMIFLMLYWLYLFCWCSSDLF